MSDDVTDRAQSIKLLAFDVDGVCTDGRLYYDEHGCRLHAFHARDGLGLVTAARNGIVTAAITGRRSPNVQARLSELRVPYIRQGIHDKETALRAICFDAGVDVSEACFVGDDVNDLPALRIVGLAAAVADAEDDVKDAAHYITRRRGGEGVLRELVELILRAQQRWTPP